MEKFDTELDCSFLCKNVEKGNACELFAHENGTCHFGKASHTSGEVGTELIDATIYTTDGKSYVVYIYAFYNSDIRKCRRM